ncbi:class I SAM-dependent methyltransferase [Methylobacterium currus]|uniref:class I SAM-dependent methyltransferase n=1 Tax=Methylobacterium currus TaxID=2051553 RepID=UPI0013E0538C|nr:class I SAM-dependent methyltransferase [Methylobacterium currus]
MTQDHQTLTVPAPPAILDRLQGRDCPVCGTPERGARPFLSASIDPARIGALSYASRKIPEFMTFRLVRCGTCETVYAAEAPGAEALARAYREAGYDSAEEAKYAARTYAEALAPRLGPAGRGAEPRGGAALEIGAGSGVFLQELLDLGFAEVIGIEPSHDAVAAAPAALRPHLRVGVFDPAQHAPGSLSLVCCFQTLEHVPDPRGLTRAAYDLLRPGGRIAFVTHDYRAPINRLLGRRSPIIDIEHMQLFCPASLRRLLGEAGFGEIAIGPLRNRYPLRYWLRLLPLPGPLKPAALSAAEALGLGRRSVGLNVGNLLSVARKPL